MFKKEQKISNPMFSGRRLIALAIPVLIDNFLFMFVGLVDSTMVASVGTEAVSAVSLIDSIAQIFFLILCSISAGGGVVAAQYIGKGDHENARLCAKQTVYVSFSISIVMTIALLLTLEPLIKLVYGNIEATVFEYCKEYFFWLIFGIPFFSIGNACATMLYSEARTKLAFYISATVNILNAVGNAILIYGFDMGVAGAAISTTIARVVYAALGILALRIPDAPIYVRNLLRVRFDKKMLGKILRIGTANGVEGGLNQIGSVLLAMMGAGLGTASVTIISVVCKIGSFGWGIPSALQLVLMTVIGQCIGAGETEQAKMYAKKFIVYTNVSLLLFFIPTILFRNQIVGIYSLDESLLSECAKHLVYASIATLVTFYAWITVPMAACRASGDTKYAVVASVVSTFIGRVAFSYIFAIVLDFGVLGMWIGMGTFHLMYAGFGFFRYRSGKWLTKKVI